MAQHTRPAPPTAAAAMVPEGLQELMRTRLRACRRQRRLSQEVVAERSGLPRSAISDIERGVRRVEAFELARFALIYGMPVGYFLGEDCGLAGVPAAADPRDSAGTLGDVVRVLAGLMVVLSRTDQYRLLHYARLLHVGAVSAAFTGSVISAGARP